MAEEDAKNSSGRRARTRWHILRRALLKKDLVLNSDLGTTLHILQFNLLHAEKVEYGSSDIELLSFNPKNSPSAKVFCRNQKSRTISRDELLGFNNTGNICIWPSEEVMCYYMLSLGHHLHGKAVIELGGGKTCLAGMIVAKVCKCSSVVLTDGNEKCVTNLLANIKLEHNSFSTECINARVLRWDFKSDWEGLTETQDLVLCADCLFFDEGRADLMECIYHVLRPQGQAIIMAPQRRGTLQKFVTLAQKKFERVAVSQKYNEDVWECFLKLKESKPDIEEDIHYPWLIELTKSQ